MDREEAELSRLLLLKHSAAEEEESAQAAAELERNWFCKSQVIMLLYRVMQNSVKPFVVCCSCRELRKLLGRCYGPGVDEAGSIVDQNDVDEIKRLLLRDFMQEEEPCIRGCMIDLIHELADKDLHRDRWEWLIEALCVAGTSEKFYQRVMAIETLWALVNPEVNSPKDSSCNKTITSSTCRMRRILEMLETTMVDPNNDPATLDIRVLSASIFFSFTPFFVCEQWENFAEWIPRLRSVMLSCVEDDTSNALRHVLYLHVLLIERREMPAECFKLIVMHVLNDFGLQQHNLGLDVEPILRVSALSCIYEVALVRGKYIAEIGFGPEFAAKVYEVFLHTSEEELAVSMVSLRVAGQNANSGVSTSTNVVDAGKVEGNLPGGNNTAQVSGIIAPDEASNNQTSSGTKLSADARPSESNEGSSVEEYEGVEEGLTTKQLSLLILVELLFCESPSQNLERIVQARDDFQRVVSRYADLIKMESGSLLPCVIGGLMADTNFIKLGAVRALVHLMEYAGPESTESDIRDIIPLIFSIMDLVQADGCAETHNQELVMYALFALKIIIATPHIDTREFLGAYLYDLCSRLCCVYPAPLIVKAAIDVYDELITIAGRHITPYVRSTERFLQPAAMYNPEVHVTQQDFELIISSLRVQTALCRSVGSVAFAPYLETYLETALKCMQTGNKMCQEIPAYIARVAEVNGTCFERYVSDVVPALAKALEKPGNSGTDDDNNEAGFKYDDSELRAHSLKLLAIFWKIIPYEPNMASFFDISVELFQTHVNDRNCDIRSSAIMGLWGMIQVVPNDERLEKAWESAHRP